MRVLGFDEEQSVGQFCKHELAGCGTSVPQSMRNTYIDELDPCPWKMSELFCSP